MQKKIFCKSANSLKLNYAKEEVNLEWCRNAAKSKVVNTYLNVSWLSFLVLLSLVLNLLNYANANAVDENIKTLYFNISFLLHVQENRKSVLHFYTT